MDKTEFGEKMAVMTFAHLKNRKQEITPSPSRTVVTTETIQPVPRPPIQKGGILSFAHMKKSNQEAPQAIPETTIEAKEESPRRTTFRIPAVMTTALLQATNYCFGCGRFLKAENSKEGANNEYGRCLREGDIDSGETEVWKVIPATATVARCWFNIKK